MSSAAATIIAALITAATTATLWVLDREGVIGSLFNRTTFNVTGIEIGVVDPGVVRVSAPVHVWGVVSPVVFTLSVTCEF